jgi:hypothetical protein
MKPATLCMFTGFLFVGLQTASATSISSMGGKSSHRCASGEDVLIEGTNQQVSLSGPCGDVSVEAIGAVVRVEQAEAIFVEGMNNTVSYGSNAAGGKPVIEVEGVTCAVNPDPALRRVATPAEATSSGASSAAAPARAIVSLESCAATRTVEGVGNGQSIACDAGERLMISGVSIKTVITGNCAALCVDGMNNQVTIQGDALAIRVEGTTNTVMAKRVDAINVDGVSNKVFWQDSAHKNGPRHSLEGIGNTVSRSK